jgi:hypothetical protein
MNRADHRLKFVAVVAQAESSPTVVERLLHFAFDLDALCRMEEKNRRRI